MNLKKNTELVFQQIADASQEANRALDAVSVIAVTVKSMRLWSFS